jgi:hypothetical protein
MAPQRFNYLSPLIVPLLPAKSGRTVLGVNIVTSLGDVAPQRSDAELTFDFRVFAAGNEVSRETLKVWVHDGAPEQAYIERIYESSELGYVEVSIAAERPYFRKIIMDNLFAIVERPDGGMFNIHSANKFGDPVIVEAMRRLGEFSLVHPAQFVSRASNTGDSVLVVNPFEGPIVVRMVTAEGKQLRHRILPHHTKLIGLADLLDDGRWTCVLYAGNNRYPAWDVRHAYDNPYCINRIDHLEYYRGSPTFRQSTALGLIRGRLRQILRASGLRHN